VLTNQFAAERKMRRLIYIALVLTVLLGLVFVMPASAAPARADRGAWAPNVAYAVNDTVTYGGSTYKCLQAHTSQTGWEPPNTPSLWQLTTGGGSGGPSGYTFCANENGTCSFSGTASVAYGANGAFNYRTATNSIACNNATFGDPISGTAKACYYQPTTSSWTNCAGENGTCSFSGTQQVRYGSGSFYSTRTATGSIGCNNATFGDPNFGVAKSCDYRSTVGSGGFSTAGWTQCAGENGTCSASGQVVYGGNGWFSQRNSSGSIACNNSTFGDPIPGTVKACYTQASTGGGGKIFAPYIDVSPGSGSAIMQLANNGSGNKHYTLAFILGSGCNASWFGAYPLNTSEAQAIGTRINELRAVGGDVIISFGGAAAPELANVCSSVSALQTQYQAVVNMYHPYAIDLDIEDFNPTAIDLRNKALKGVTGTRIHYTLGVLQSGFTQAQMDVLNNARTNGTRVDLVNIMAMDYGGSVPDMYGAAVSAAQAARSWLNNNGFSGTQLGITPMIGQNDSAGEVFTLSNASSLVSWANSNGVTELAFWSVGRDNGGCPGQTTASATCSGVSQSNFQFSSIFHGFAP